MPSPQSSGAGTPPYPTPGAGAGSCEAGAARPSSAVTAPQKLSEPALLGRGREAAGLEASETLQPSHGESLGADCLSRRLSTSETEEASEKRILKVNTIARTKREAFLHLSHLPCPLPALRIPGTLHLGLSWGSST